jgi:hypothetical protein
VGAYSSLVGIVVFLSSRFFCGILSLDLKPTARTILFIVLFAVNCFCCLIHLVPSCLAIQAQRGIEQSGYRYQVEIIFFNEVGMI